ncbi:MAG: class I SAM-dependent methyltransferase [Flavobacteriaceae bacterium]|nr:class I SAM-dependent methyltransferase [Flavobacteriaceae bacterium]MDG1961947.1 class I SAM-dependent methyltransferase [Flavobacteriaceae bacterium]
MNFHQLLTTEVQHWIRTTESSLSDLALKGSPFPDIPIRDLLEQVSGWRKTKDKLPLWHLTKDIVFPEKLSLEQCSSEVTGLYKSSILSGDSLADITGGFGVDAYYLGQHFNSVDYFENNQELCAITKHNFEQLGLRVNCRPLDGIEGIKGKNYDAVYVDPARRHGAKGKVYFLEDCTPDLTQHLPALLRSAPEVLVKTSPMLDLSKGLNQFGTVKAVHIVAVQNEVKELLWHICAHAVGRPEIHTINTYKDRTERFSFVWGDTIQNSFTEPSVYLYEPNAAILKSGAFDLLPHQYTVHKLALHAHLYTSSELIEFPGRRFLIDQQLPYNKNNMRQFKNAKCHVTTRHFPETVAQLRQKWQLSDGGERYLFFTTLESGQKIVLSTQKI